jgi:glycosyltransferase involved in cell wall biosynthesis
MTAPTRALVVIGAMPDSPHFVHAGGQVTATRGLLQYCAEAGIAVAPIDTTQSSFPIPSFARRTLRGLARTARLLGLLARRRVGGAIIFAGEGGSLAERCLQAALCRAARVPAVVCLRSGYILTDARDSEKHRRLYARLLAWPARVVVQGKSWIGEMAALGFPVDRVEVVPNWLPPEFPVLPAPRAASANPVLRLLFVGWLTERKGIRELMQAFDDVTTGADVSLAIAGGGDLAEELDRWVGQHGSRAIVAGWVESDALIAHYDAADVLVLPSYAEGFPNVVIEAMARGLPVIATRVGAIPDTLTDGHNGALIDAQDSAGLAAAIRPYIANPELVSRHGAAALATAIDQHSWRDNCGRLLALAGMAQPATKA